MGSPNFARVGTAVGTAGFSEAFSGASRLFKTPSLSQPKVSDPEAQKRAAALAEKLRAQRGYKSTILSDMLPADSSLKQKLGE